MTQSTNIDVAVAEIADITRDVRRIVLVAANGAYLPAASAGAHIVLSLRDGTHVWRNAYSLTMPPGQRDRYIIMVRRAAPSRGGSAFIHRHLAIGDRLSISGPHNMFWPVSTARKHLMFAAGIGITPFLSYLPALAAAGTPFELHVRCRPGDAAAFRALLAGWPDAHVHSSGPELAFEPQEILARQPIGTHIYLCGPQGFMANMARLAACGGWPPEKIHQEIFGAPRGGAGFRAILARSGITIDVSPDQPLLDAIEAAGIDAPCLCRGGACGHCLLHVLEGEPDHRDHFLSAEERAAGSKIMACVSRAKSAVLVLDI